MAIQTTKTITSDTLRTVRSFARTSQALVLALQDFTDAEMTDKQKQKANAASANVGAQMLKLKNALPSEPSQLRMHVESIKQKVNAIVTSLDTSKTFANHCQRAAIVRSAKVALENCDVFIKEYVEHKATVAAKAA